MTYKLNVSGGIVRVSDGANIPRDPDNLDYQAYLVWANAGNTAEVDQADHAQLVLQALTEARAQRALLFSRFDGLQASALATGNSAQALEIEGVKVSLRSMTTDVDLDGLTTLVAMRKAFAARWKQIAQPLSGPLKLAFAALDA